MKHLFKIFQTTLILSFFFFFFSKSVHASMQNFIEAINAPDYNLQSMINGKNEDGLLPITADSLTGYLIGLEEKGSAKTTQDKTSQNSALNSLAQLTGSLYNQPTSSTDYLAYLKQNIQPSPVYAQGEGYNMLSPLIEIWISVRNISYIFFIIIFVIVGFMIMFRSKLNPQTVINVQLALPKIIISLILVTFSFAIMGFIVDIAFLLNSVVAQAIGNKLTTIGTPNGYLWQAYDAQAGFGFMKDVLLGFSNNGASTNFLNNAVISNIWDTITGLPALVREGDMGSIINLVIAMTIVSSVLKIFFMLLTKHVTIILYTIASPLMFLFTSLGQADYAKPIKSFASACLTFPATLIILNLAMFFSKNPAPTNGSIPPFYPEGVGSELSFAQAAGGLIGLGMLMIASKIPEVIDQALGNKPGVMGAAGQEITGGLRKIPLIGGMLG